MKKVLLYLWAVALIFSTSVEGAETVSQDMATSNSFESGMIEILQKDYISDVLEKAGLSAVIEDDVPERIDEFGIRYTLYHSEMQQEEHENPIFMGTVSVIVDGDECGVSGTFISAPNTPFDAAFQWEDWKNYINFIELLSGKREIGSSYNKLSKLLISSDVSFFKWEEETLDGFWSIHGTSKTASLHGGSEVIVSSGGYVMWIEYYTSMDLYERISTKIEDLGSLPDM